MAFPVAVFGFTNNEFTDQVFNLRKKIVSLGYEEEPEEIFTVPHLTFAWNKDFDMNKNSNVYETIVEMTRKLPRFTLSVTEYIEMDGNIAAKFDNSYSSQVATAISMLLGKYNFETVLTDHMRLIRSQIKIEHIDEVRQMVNNTLDKSIEVVGIALAGKLLTQEDFLWEVPLALDK